MIQWTSAFAPHESRNAGIQNGALPKNVTTIAMDGLLITRGSSRLRPGPHRGLLRCHQVGQAFDDLTGRSETELIDIAFEVRGLRIGGNRRAVRAFRVEEREHRIRAERHVLYELALGCLRVVNPAGGRFRVIADPVDL